MELWNLIEAILFSVGVDISSKAERRLAEKENRTREHIDHVGARWRREGYAARFGPVSAVYYGRSPDHLDSFTPEYGALGVVEDRLWFVGQSSAGFEIVIPLDIIRWVSLANVGINLPTVYRETDDEWRLDLFDLNDTGGLVKAMQAAAPVPVATDVDYGPTAAVRLRQDMLGQWQRDYTLSLYLAPDRLLAGWHTAARLDCIRGLAVLPSAGFTKTALLRIDHTDPEGRPQVIGFEMALDRAKAWADVLHQRTGVTVDDALGRKKKEDE